MAKKIKNYALILASGKGSRYGADIPKQFIKIAGKTIFEYTVEAFERTQEIDEIIIVVTPEYRNLAEEILNKNKYNKINQLLNGGETRKESSYIGISSINDNEANVLIHDCARPFVSKKIITDCIKALDKYNAAVVAIPAVDTIMEIENNTVASIPDRNKLMCAQTPQCFKLSLIKKAHELAKNDCNFTDDCGLILKNHLAFIHIVEGARENMKITYKSDIYTAQAILGLKNIQTKV